jgi:4-hydroxy-3-methylbut-2-enyl diphosphate reductase
MQINLAKSIGFCFGVKRAIDITFNTATLGKKVYMLGDIVHNEIVSKQIQKAGIKKIKKLSQGKNKILLIQAHGIPLETIGEAVKLGYEIIDATCPMVKEIHSIAQKMEQKGYRIIVVGDKQHDEVRGITGHLKNKALVVDHIKHMPLKSFEKIKNGCVVVQSTQNLENAQEIVKRLKRYIKNLEFFNTICRPTRIRQEEIKKMPLENDLMIIIGSKNSANTKRLYEISKSLNKRSYWINSVKEIKQKWFRQANSVGVTAGASTPDSTTQEIIKYIHSRLNRA